jgi:ferrochelatase
MAQALERLQGADSLTVVPLFPQFAEATTGSVFERLEQLLKGLPQLAGIPQKHLPFFWDQAGFIEACAHSMERSVDLKAMDHVLFSFHGLPKKDVLRKRGCRADASCCVEPRPDCYRSQCIATAKALAARLDLKEGKWGWAFQSRLGKVEWIKPYTSETLEALAKSGTRHVAVMCPSFVADCLETLEEIGMDNKELFLESGGVSYTLAPCPNSDEAWVESFAKWLKPQLPGLE